MGGWQPGLFMSSAAQDAHRGRLVAWMKAAGGTATAFDMTTKGIMHQAFEASRLYCRTAGRHHAIMQPLPDGICAVGAQAVHALHLAAGMQCSR
jgi:hypothetical protein